MGKSWALLFFASGRTTKAAVRQLRETWRGANNLVKEETGSQFKDPVSCPCLSARSLDAANVAFIPTCEDTGLSGTAGALEVSDAPCKGSVAFPVNLTVMDFANDPALDDEEDEENRWV